MERLPILFAPYQGLKRGLFMKLCADQCQALPSDLIASPSCELSSLVRKNATASRKLLARVWKYIFNTTKPRARRTGKSSDLKDLQP